MDDFLQMNIFFVVATISVAVVGLLIAVALFHLVRLLRTLERIAHDVEGEAKALITDIEDVRLKVQAEGFKLAHMLSLAAKTGKRLIARAKQK